MQNVLIEPLFTEKHTAMQADMNKYGFLVVQRANKVQIAQEVERRFQVKVTGVQTMRYKGKTKTQFRKSGRFTGKSPSFKKAVVTIEKGQTLEIFEEA